MRAQRPFTPSPRMRPPLQSQLSFDHLSLWSVCCWQTVLSFLHVSRPETIMACPRLMSQSPGPLRREDRTRWTVHKDWHKPLRTRLFLRWTAFVARITEVTYYNPSSLFLSKTISFSIEFPQYLRYKLDLYTNTDHARIPQLSLPLLGFIFWLYFQKISFNFEHNNCVLIIPTILFFSISSQKQVEVAVFYNH